MPTLNLSETLTTENYSGAAVTYTMGSAGVFMFECWGGGGGGGAATNNNVDSPGGAAGMVVGWFSVSSGDAVKMEVGQGGQRGTSSPLTGGAGGYPDGGYGGCSSSNAVANGGGGGSTRIYLNNTLMIVAGAGGGGLVNGRTMGLGGGLIGGGASGIAATGTPGWGGTQSGGGSGPGAGSHLQGGNSPGTINVSNASSGGGGGGGWYGGGAGGGAGSSNGVTYTGSFGSGGGGSSYINSGLPGKAATYMGAGHAPFNSGNLPSGIGQGGTNSNGSSTAGGNGAVVMRLVAAPGSITSGSPATIGYTGAPVTYQVGTTGRMTFEMWGAGGGGPTENANAGDANNTLYGGAGGNTTGSIYLTTGDLLTFEVGQGGQPGVAATAGGLGGWPDGGAGGLGSFSGAAMGGGGGSTRILLNNVLVAVAGGGGAGNLETSGSFGGGGGGANGQTGGGSGGNGGSQSGAGGNGASGRFGGTGYSTGTNTTAQSTSGGGGGGGYWGGGGGRGSSGSNPGGGGGSGFYHTQFVPDGVTTAAVAAVPHNSGSLPSGAAVPGFGTNGTTLPTAGGNGAIVVNLPAYTLTAPQVVIEGYTGLAQSYTAAVGGQLDFEIYGGGGGGGFDQTGGNGQSGGCGGSTKGSILVSSGDVIKVEVGQGGFCGSSGLGGGPAYPDGGEGGCSGVNSAANFYSWGGGGGSTRLYVNNVLMAIAGGGGGASQNAGSGKAGGTGGGTTGGAGATTAGTAGGGGTQTAGGAGGSNVAGSSEQGGKGHTSSQSYFLPSSTAAGGGGGGYFGGGGGGAVNNAGGGGSGYINTASVYNSATQNGGNFSANSYGHMPTGTGNGGSSGNTIITNGNNGAAYLSLAVPPAPPTTKTSITFTGSPTVYQATSAGVLTCKLWGAGGGGGSSCTNGFAGQGGGGGFTSATLPVAMGDVIEVVVGGGGKGATSNTAGGAGGYPNGGYGGSTTTTSYVGGGGGGSSHILVNGVPLIVAAGGGGGRGSGNGQTGGGAANQTSQGGYGGDTTGGPGVNKSTSIVATGGTQTGGGSNNNGQSAQNGSFMQGGPGSNAAFGVSGGFITGGGGGGGYYGGAGGGYSSVTVGGGGGGGSSYIKNSALGVTQNLPGTSSGTVTTTSGGASDADYTSGNGVGGASATSGAASNGGDGKVIITFAAGVPGFATGNFGTSNITFSAATGTAGVLVNVAVDPGTLNMVTVDGTGGVPQTAPGSIGTITFATINGSAGIANQLSLAFPGPITNNGDELGGQGFSDAFITIPFSDNDIDMVEVDGTSQIPQNLVKPFPGPIALTVMTATIPGLTSGDIGEIDLTGPEGSFTEIVQAFGDFGGELDLSIGDGSATGDANATQVDGQSFLTINAQAMNATVFVITSGVIGELDLTSPEAQAGNGSLLFPGPITFDTVEAETDIGPIEVPFSNDIDLTVPTLSIDTEAQGDNGTITMVAPQGFGPDGIGHAFGDVGTIQLFSLNTSFGGNAFGDLQTIILTEVDGTATDGSAHPAGDIGTLTISPPVGEFNYIAITLPTDDITFVAPTGDGHGNASAGLLNFGPSLVLVGFDGTATGEANPQITDMPLIQMSSPVAAPVRGATVLASIVPAIITMKLIQAIAGPANSAGSDADLASLALTIESPESYASIDTIGWANPLLYRSEVVNVVPNSLNPREIAINEAEGALFSRDGVGAVQKTPLAAIAAGATVPNAGTTNFLLRGDGTWGIQNISYDRSIRIGLPQQTIILSEGVLGGISSSLTPNMIYYRPFFVPKTITISALKANIITTAAGTINFGICEWSLPEVPGIALMSGSASTATAGPVQLGGSLKLTPGWYAAMIVYVGSGTPVFGGYSAPIRIDSSFNPSGDPMGAFTGSFASLGTPSGHSTKSIAFLTANSTNA